LHANAQARKFRRVFACRKQIAAMCLQHNDKRQIFFNPHDEKLPLA